MLNDPRERDVTFTNGDVRLAGTLAVPDRQAQCQGVVLVGGGGPSDRDSYGMFPPMRSHLVDAGIAVLSYDKRGVGESSGHWLDSTMDDLAADAVAALSFLREQDGVSRDRVGLFGHSEGGWLVLRAAAPRDDVAFVITNGCPGMSPAMQVRYSLARQAHESEEDIQTTVSLYDQLTAAARRGADFDEARRLFGTTRKPAAFAEYWAEFSERDWEFLKRKQDHDPIPDELRLQCPHLATYGGADPLVPVADSLALFGAAASSRDSDGRYMFASAVFPGANHRGELPSGEFAPGFHATVARWIHDQASDDASSGN